MNAAGVVVAMSLLHRLVSKKKRRFDEGSYSLDMSYITPTVVAMGFPSENFESLYRNPASQVFSFFESRHTGAYKVYNLCSERAYDARNFHVRVERHPFDDHMAPPFRRLFECTASIDQWLRADDVNVAVVHCKAGKGRTGVMLSAYLVWSGESPTADDALESLRRAAPSRVDAAVAT